MQNTVNDEYEKSNLSIADESVSQSSSSKISSEAQVEKSDTSSSQKETKSGICDDDSITDRMETDSFPQSEKLETDSFDLKQREPDISIESLDDTERTTSSKYKVKEREDILDDDDDVGCEAGKVAASFYIGESSGNIITKSSSEKRSEFDVDESESKSNQDETQLKTNDKDGFEFVEQSNVIRDDTQREVRFNLEPEEIKLPHEIDAFVSDIQQTHVFLESERDSNKIERSLLEEKCETELSEKIAQEQNKDVNVKGREADLLEFDRSYGSDNVLSDPFESHVDIVEIATDASEIGKNIGAEPVICFPDETYIKTDRNVEIEELDSLDSTSPTEPQRVAVIHSPIESKPILREVECAGLIDTNIYAEKISEKPYYETSEIIPVKTTGEILVEATQYKVDENILSHQSRPLVVHSPIETLKEFEQTKPSESIIESNKNLLDSDLAFEIDFGKTKPAPVLHSPVEPTKEFALVESDSQSDDAIQKQQHEDSTSNSGSINKLEVVHRKGTTKVTQKTRWSATDPDYSSAGSHNDSDNSRPCSSDVENIYVSYPNSSAEYQTALDASLIPGSTEYHTAASTFDHSGKTISSQDSMKSFSESSGNLGSVDVSEASETLVPSTADDLHTDTRTKDLELEFDENEQRLSSLDTFGEVALDDLGSDIELEVKMKRSHEMIFQGDFSQEKSLESLISIEKSELSERKASDEEFKAQSEFGTSSGDNVSYLSMSLSSNTSNVDTIVENVPDDLASSFGSSLIGSYEMKSILKDDMTSTSFEDQKQFDHLIMTTSTVIEDDVSSVNTQITTDDVSSARRGKGHKRNDSTTFLANLEISKLSQESTDSSSLDDEMIIHDVPDDERKESDDSDYDRYETEYSRSFKTPTDRQRKKKTMAAQKPEVELERKKSVPSIETIVEDVYAEESIIEAERMRGRKEISQNMLDYSNIPDIMITDDPTKYVSDDDDEPEPEIIAVEIPSTKEQSTEIKKKEEIPSKIPKLKSISNEQYEQLIEQQYKTQIEEENKSDSPDSFEMVEHEQHDISDEFVIVEEVAKEASELMTEGQSVSIKQTKYVKKHDDEVEKIIVKSAPAATNEGSTILQGRHDLAFEFEESPSSGACTESSDEGANGMESSRKWVEMQLAEQAQNLRYPYEVDRGVLEDIKEEDTDFEVGSSRISSFKDSYSSNDFDAAAARRHQLKEHDDISMNSLQEFESLEQAISLENKRFHSGSHDSLSNGSFPKRGLRSVQADEISLASLNDFEGLENACLEATLLEIKAKEEHALLLSRSDESNKSGKSDEKNAPAKDVAESRMIIVTKAELVKTTTEFPQQTIPSKIPKPFKIDEPEEDLSSSNLMEVSTDSLESALKQAKQSQHAKTGSSHHGSTDSLEMTKSGDAMTSSIDSIEVSKGATAKSDCDSIEQLARGEKRDSIDSIDAQYAAMTQSIHFQHDSIDANTFIDLTSSVTTSSSLIQETKTITTISTASSSGYGGGISKDISSDSLNIAQSEPELLITSTESLDHTSSTFATYHNETDSQMTMSGSMTSCDSNTLVDNSDTIRNEFYQDESDATDLQLLSGIDVDDKFGTRMTSTTMQSSAYKNTSSSRDVDKS